MSSHSPPSPASAKMALSFPNKLSMVPAANLDMKGSCKRIEYDSIVGMTSDGLLSGRRRTGIARSRVETPLKS